MKSNLNIFLLVFLRIWLGISTRSIPEAFHLRKSPLSVPKVHLREKFFEHNPRNYIWRSSIHFEEFLENGNTIRIVKASML